MHTLSATQLRDQFLKGERSAASIVQETLQRIEKDDKKVGAFLSVFAEKAVKKAACIDEKRAKGEKLGRLAGVPVAMKDNILVEGEIASCGSKFLTNFRAPYSATCTQLLEDEDAIIIGRTNMDEFAMGSSTENSALQKTGNPWNLKCSPGGSSGGSAAAVAARFCPLAFGSDTGGSIRQPAALTGIYGYKPTYGRVSRYGLVAFGSSLDQIGPFGRTVEDIATSMEIVGRHCNFDSTSLPEGPYSILSNLKNPIKGMKIGVPWQFLEGLNDEVRKNFEASLQVLRDQGAEIVEVDLSILKYGIAIYYVLATAEASTNLARFDGVRYGVRAPSAESLSEVYELSRQAGFGPEVKRRIMLGTFVLSSGYQDAYYKKAQKVRTLIIQKHKEAFQKCDLIATPTSPFAAFESGSIKDPLQLYLADIYTVSANLAGTPCISIPSGFTADMKPLGLQLTGPQTQDARVLQAAYAFEAATNFNNHIPEAFR